MAVIYSFVVAILAVSALGVNSQGGFSGFVDVPLTERQGQAPIHQGHHEFWPSGYARLVNEKTSLTLLYQNNLNASDDENHVGAILLDAMGQHDIRDACDELGESMISVSTIAEHKEDFRHLFSYLFYAGGRKEDDEEPTLVYIRNGVLSVTNGAENFVHYPFPSRNVRLPVLCTQTSTGSAADRGKNSDRKLIRVESQSNMYVGFRDQKSFRFLGIPYADAPARFTYSTPYSGNSRTIRATEYGPMCAQADGGSENCLYLNIHTPYIPKKNSTDGLRPVLFWIHGGDFTSGTGSDALTDGGNLASRENIVVVTINYRLSTLGFLAVPGTDIRGNYGIADQVLALKWTIKNIAEFGGDPQRITIAGEAAGASSVKALLGSPHAVGKFQGAIAVSNLEDDHGQQPVNGYATSHSMYLSIDESYNVVGRSIFSDAGCSEGTIEQQISCLRDIPASTIVRLPAVARHIVQDGKYVNTAKLNLIEQNGDTANVSVMFGNAANSGASLSNYPSNNIQSELEGIKQSLGMTSAQAQRIIESGLFPYHDTGNITLDSFNVSQRIATDLYARCLNQATVFAGVSSGVFQPSYYYEIQRTTGGFDPNNLGGPESTRDFPDGDPELSYFRLHGSDLPFFFGTISTLRDSLDLYAARLISAYFAEFVRSGQPNPNPKYLAARGYKTTLDAVLAFDPWEPVSHSEGPIQLLDFPSQKASFQDLAQCEFLGYPIIYHLT